MDPAYLTDGALAKFRAVAREHRLAGLAGLSAALAAPALLGAGGVALWRYDRRAIADGEWWRLVTGNLVHVDLAHLALNLAGLALLWWLFVADARWRDWLAVALLAALAVGLGLYAFDPALGWYVGFSGVEHGCWAAAGVFALGRRRLEGLVTLALLGAKTAAEQLHGPLVAAALDPHLAVVVDAHLYGAIAGLATAAALRFRRASL
jgi:rhomboid family GlyGly-CTERM serine protease